jgi:putative SOS response-associated peptidase YedK
MRWLSDLDEKNLAGMLHPPAEGTVERHRVARTIGNVRATGPQLIAPI